MVGISGTSKTGDAHYYYSCLSRTRRDMNCHKKPIQKQFIEDMVIDTTAKVVASEQNIDFIAKKICAVHERACHDNTKLKMLEQKRLEAVKAQNNIIKAIEQGIFNSATKSRLNELETLITQYDFDIQQEKNRQYSFLTVEQIKDYMREFVNADTADMEIRKLIVNAFVREVILYDNEVTIIYNFIDNNIPTTVTKEYVENIEQQIESADPSAVSSLPSSYNEADFSPKKRHSNECLFFFLPMLRIFQCAHALRGELGEPD